MHCARPHATLVTRPRTESAHLPPNHTFAMPSFTVRTVHENYPILVERGAIHRLGEFLPPRCGKIFLLTDHTVWRLHGPSLQKALAPHPSHPILLPAGEEHKRLATIERAAEQMVAAGADRSSLVVAFGGGIVGDLGGFLAAIFMRGIPVLQLPTTLLAQVDAAIGGKTGANLVCGKNLIGAFHQPKAVLVDPELLTTLPEREYRAGLFEVIKYGVIASPELFSLLATQRNQVLARQPAVIEQLIAESVRIKAEVVSADERESDLRRILNFGHTFGHALEAETAYTRFLHGEAVGFGMRAATHLAARLGLLNQNDHDAIVRLIDHYGPLPPLDGIPPEHLFERLRADKKTVQGRLHFIVPERIGQVRIISDVDPDAVRTAICLALS